MELVFKATTRGGAHTISVFDDGGIQGGKDRYSIYTDWSTDYADTKDEVLAAIFFAVFDGTRYTKVETDLLGISSRLIDIVKAFDTKYKYLEKEPKGSDARILYFDIARCVKNNLKDGVPEQDIFNKIDESLLKMGFSKVA